MHHFCVQRFSGTKQALERLVRALLLFMTASIATAQNVHSPADISNTNANLVVSWTGTGSLQSSLTLADEWQDVLEAGSPFMAQPSETQRFFRVVSHWGKRANLIEGNSEMGVAELDGKIYVMGGYPSSRITVNTVQVYDSTANSWSLTTPLLTGVNHPMPAVANGRIYLIGGQTNTGSAFVSDVQEFDPETSKWSFKTDMPTARSAGAAAVIGDLIYVAGGRPPHGNDFAVYNATSNNWKTLPDLPSQRNHLAACAIDGKVYVVGGRLGAGFSSAITNVLEVFDPASNEWNTLAPMPTTRGGINGIAANGHFFVFGGEASSGVFDEMEMYVPEQDRWYELEPLPTAVHGVTAAAFLNGFIHLPGGGTARGGSSGSRLHQVFSLEGINP